MNKNSPHCYCAYRRRREKLKAVLKWATLVLAYLKFIAVLLSVH